MAITFDAAAGNKVSSGTTNTYSHTVATGQSNQILLVSVSTGDSSVTSVTYGGQSLTQLASVAYHGGVLQLWYKLAPLTGANNVVVTVPATSFIVSNSASYNNVAQSSTFGTAATNNDGGTAGTSSTNTVTTTSTSQVVFDVVDNFAGATDTPTASQTKRNQAASSGDAIGDIAATGSNMTLTWSFTSAFWAAISVAMNAAAGGAVTHLRIMDGYGGVFS